jgi:regulator of ribonuclease activity A
MAQMSLGVKALGTSPFKTEKRGAGEVNVTLMMLNQIVQPKEYIYADWNGILISKQALEI